VTLLRLTSWQLAAVFASGTAVVTALYLLRVRPRRTMVPFEPLWADVLAAERRTNPLRRLRRLLSLLLQVLMVALLALALADPRLGPGPRARHLVIVIDASASMQAVHEGRGGSRFSQAVAAARQTVEALRPGDSAMLVAAETVPRVLCLRTGSQRALLQALSALTPSEAHADLPAALRLAAAAIDDDPDGGILLLSDVNVPMLRDLPPGLDADRLEVRRFGVPGPNVAVTAFDARLSAADPLRAEIYVELRCFADESRNGTLRLYAGDRRAPVEVLPVSLEPGGVWRRTVREALAVLGSGPLRAELDLDDDLAADNVAYAFLPPPPTLTVELVADTPDFFLVKALEAFPTVTLRQMRPADYRFPDPGVVPIFQDWAPEKPPAGSAIYINPPPARSPIPVARVLQRAPITEVNRRHPLTRQVVLDEVEAAPALAFRTRPGDVVLARSVDAAVIVARRAGGGRLLVIGFAPAASDLPLRVAFPIVIGNALNWIAGGAAMADRRSFRVGSPMAVPVPDDVGDAAAVLVSASRPPLTEPVTVHDGRARLSPRSIGFYRISARDLTRTVAVNTVDLRECDLRVTSAGHRVPATAPVAPTRDPRSLTPVLWPILLWCALAVAAGEWLAYHRRWTV